MMKSAKSPFKKKTHSRESSIEDRGFFHRRSTSGSNIPIAQHSRQASNGALNIGPPVSGVNSSHKRTASNSSRSSQNSNFLAEQYERDRRAILVSCFSASDSKSPEPPNSYITHVRIIEDSRYPSSRPALDSKLENKKKRILILSSKANNPKDVQLHKGRENQDGRFQIGRTWSLKELTAIERDTEVNEGFVLTMSKRYYWETNSAKERVVFIKSLVNTFMQAFDGHVPELINWDLSMFYLDERTYQRAMMRKSVSFVGPTSIPRESSNASPTQSASPHPSTRLPNLDTSTQMLPSPRSPARTPGRSPSLNDQFFQNKQDTSKPPSNKSGYSNSPTLSNDSHHFYDQHYQQRNAQQTRMWQSRQQEQEQSPQQAQQAQQARQAHQEWKAHQTQKEQQARKEQQMRQAQQARQAHQAQQAQKEYERQQEMARIEQQRQQMAAQAQLEREALQAQEAGSRNNPSLQQPVRGDSSDFMPLSQKTSHTSGRSNRFSPDVASSPYFNSTHQFPTKQSTPDMSSVATTQLSVKQSTPEIPSHMRQSAVKQGTVESFDADDNLPLPVDLEHSQSRQDNLLEDLNNVLGDASNTSVPFNSHSDNFQERPEVPSDEISSPFKRDVSPMEVAPLSIPQTQPINARSTQEQSPVVDVSDVAEDLNASTIDTNHEDSNDLSFERGDEIPLNDPLPPTSPHVYHEVTTIQEEGPPVEGQRRSVVAANVAEQSQDGEKVAKAKDVVDIEDEELLGILTDINWELGDAADDLVEKLNMKLAETTYALNNGLLSLESLGPSLLPYEKQVDEVCDKMNPIFSLFLMEMGNVAEDIEYIENQKNGLQIESANKKNLWNTLTELMNTVSLDDATLNELLNSPVGEKTLLRMETLLKSLFRALKAISGENDEEDYNLGEMQALKERRETYEKVTKVFLERLVNALSGMFVNIYKDNITEDHLSSFLNRLLIFSSLTLFCKDVDGNSYNFIVDKWVTSIQTVYNRICEKMIHNLRKYKLDRREVHSDASDKSIESLMVQWESYKKTRALSEVVPSSAKAVSHLKSSLESLGKLCISYQNFIDCFFHISSSLDFEEYLEQFGDPNTRTVSLYSVKPMQSDREAALKEAQLVSRIFRPNVAKISSYFASILRADSSKAPVIMFFLEEKLKTLESSNQEFLLAALSQILDQVKQMWSEYVEDEVVRLERAEINMSSRSISPSVIDFALFVKNSHEFISYAQSHSQVNSIQSFDSLKCFESDSSKLGKAITRLLSGKEGGAGMLSDVRGVGSEATDIDKIITLLLNSYWLLEILSMFNVNGSFDSTIQAAKSIFDTERETYAAYLLRDAMPKLTSFIHGASSLVGTSSSGGSNLGKWAAYSRQNLDNILAGYTSSEIDTLVKRLYQHMMRHLSHELNDLMKGTLCDKLWSCIQGQTVSLYLKLYTLIEKHYKGALVRFTKNDIITAFERYKE